MTESSAAVTALSADETPTAVPGTTADGPSSETPIVAKGDGTKRKRTSVRALRAELQTANGHVEALRLDSEGSRRRNRELRETLYQTQDLLTESGLKLTTTEATLANTQLALELAFSILSVDRSATDIVAFLPKKAKEYGINFGTIGNEVLEALGKAYAKAPERAVNAVVAEDIAKGEAQLKELLAKLPTGGRRGEVRTVSGSGIGPLMSALLGLDGGPTSFAGGDSLSAILGQAAEDSGYTDSRNTVDTIYCNPGCTGHPRS